MISKEVFEREKKEVLNELKKLERAKKIQDEKRKKYPLVFLFLFIAMLAMVAEEYIFAGESVDGYATISNGNLRVIGYGNFSECIYVNNGTEICSASSGSGATNLTNLLLINQTNNANITITGNFTFGAYLCNSSSCYTLEQFLGSVPVSGITSAQANLTYEKLGNVTEDEWIANFSAMQGSTCAADNYVYGIDTDGTFKCRSDETGGLTSAQANLTYINRTGDDLVGNFVISGNITINGWGNFTNLTVVDLICNQSTCYTIENFLSGGGSTSMDYTNISMLNESANIFTGVGDRYIQVYETVGGARVDLAVRNNVGYIGTVTNFPFIITSSNSTAIYIDTNQDVGINSNPTHGYKLEVAGSLWVNDWINTTNVTLTHLCNGSTCYTLEDLVSGNTAVADNLTNVAFLNDTQKYTGLNNFTANTTITNLTMSSEKSYFCLTPDCSKFICANSTTIVISNSEVGVVC